MEYIKKYEGFLDLFKSGLTMVGGRVSKFLGKRKDLKTTKSKSEMVWTWIEEIESLGEFDFKLNLQHKTKILDTHNESYKFQVDCQSKTDDSLKSKVDSGSWYYGKFSNFDQMLFDTLESIIREVKVLTYAKKSNTQFVEDFPIEEVEDYLIDLKDLFHGEVQVEFEAAGKYLRGFGKSGFKELPSYKVTIKPFLKPEQIEGLRSELKVIDSNIRNIGLKINDNIDKLLQFYESSSNFRFELIRSEK